jgi:hypothetical protein
MEHLKLILILKKNPICGIYLKWFNTMVLFIFLLLMISFIQIQPVQKTIDEIVEI